MFMHALSQQVIHGYDEPVVSTEFGKLRGICVDGTYIFRGVRYAKAGRFALPARQDAWEGIKDARVFGRSCATLNVPYVPDMYRVPHFFYPEDEDCFFLNIWTGSLDKDEKRPVMVWLHGGGGFSGHAMEVYSYDGENLAKDKNVVVVSLNHRLHMLGYLNLSAYGEKYRYSGSIGTADIIAALAWIHDNITAFGGDPDNVTVFGQSSGGGKVVSVMQASPADGLYHKAILESGGTVSRDESFEALRTDTAEYAKILVEERLKLTPSTISEIETMNRYDLFTAASEALWLYRQRHGKPYWFRAAADGEIYLPHPYISSFRKEALDIPMMVGHCFSENRNNYDLKLGEGHKNNWDEKYTAQVAEQLLGGQADICLELFAGAYPEKSTADALFYADTERRNCLRFCRERTAAGSAPVWNWLFNLEAPFMNGTLPWHNAEEPYVFRNAAYTEAQYEPGISEYVEEAVSGAWTAFAAHGDPNHSALPAWDPVSETHTPTMLFDKVCRQAVDHDKDFLDHYRIPRSPGVHTEFNAAIEGVMPRDGGAYVS